MAAYQVTEAVVSTFYKWPHSLFLPLSDSLPPTICPSTVKRELHQPHLLELKTYSSFNVHYKISIKMVYPRSKKSQS